MKIINLNNIKHESAHCYISSFENLAYPGEGLGSTKQSSLILFENGIQLGPSSSSHAHIRTIGKGAYSHWGSQLYFSTSDNSNPKTNGRNYSCLIPTNVNEERDQLLRLAFSQASNSAFLHSVLSGSVSTQGAELHSAYCLRSLLLYCANAGAEIDGASCLEVGASPTNGLAISLGLIGARKVALNNIEQISNEIDLYFAKNVAFLTGLITPIKKTLEEIVDVSADGKKCRLKSEIYIVLGGIDAVRLADYIKDVELIFSFSVLEHIRRLPEVMRSLRKLAATNCVSIHSIDARDHTDFSNPLKYLYLSQNQFDLKYSEEHNRWRWPDYIKIFSETGWEIISQQYMGLVPVLENGRSDMIKIAGLGPEKMLHSKASSLHQIIRPDEIEKLSPEFRHFTPEELSVLAFVVVMKPSPQESPKRV